MTPTYLDHLDAIAQEDAAGLKKAQESYGDSWMKRGGVGAFMMLARKWDRIEKRLAERPKAPPGHSLTGHSIGDGLQELVKEGDRYDIFAHIACDDRAEGLIDDIRDLRRYLMLVEARARATGAKSATSTHRDNALARGVELAKEAMERANSSLGEPVSSPAVESLKTFVRESVRGYGDMGRATFVPTRHVEIAVCDALAEVGAMERLQLAEGALGFRFLPEES